MSLELRNGNCRVIIIRRWDQQINSESSPTRLREGRRGRATIERWHRIKINTSSPQHVQKGRHIRKSQRLPTSYIDVLSSIRNCTHPKSVQKCSVSVRSNQKCACA